MNIKGLPERVVLKEIYFRKVRDEETGIIKEVHISLVYLQETEKGIYEHRYDDLLLPIRLYDLPTIKPEVLFLNGFFGRFLLDAGFGRFLLDAGFGDCPFSRKNHTVKVIEEKTKEMTLEEIEKALGHKVKIVKEKGEK